MYVQKKLSKPTRVYTTIMSLVHYTFNVDWHVITCVKVVHNVHDLSLYSYSYYFLIHHTTIIYISVLCLNSKVFPYTRIYNIYIYARYYHQYLTSWQKISYLLYFVNFTWGKTGHLRQPDSKLIEFLDL